MESYVIIDNNITVPIYISSSVMTHYVKNELDFVVCCDLFSEAVVSSMTPQTLGTCVGALTLLRSSSL